MFKNTYTYISMLFFLGATLIFLSSAIINKESSALKYSTFEVPPIIDYEKLDKLENKKTIKLSFIGDSLLASFKGQGEFQDLLDTHDYDYPFKNVIDIFKDDDYTIAFWYYTKAKYANIYRESSIELVSIMNNHTYDYNHQGYLDTIKALNDADVLYGAEDPVILEKDGFKIGVICANLFHDFQGDEINENIKNIKDKVNYVIVYLEPIEVYKDKKIVYSLGSFLFGGTTTLVNRTIIYQMNIEYDKESNTYKESDNIIPCYLYSSNTGYEKWLPSVIKDETEKQYVLDFMNGIREKPI